MTEQTDAERIAAALARLRGPRRGGRPPFGPRGGAPFGGPFGPPDAGPFGGGHRPHGGGPHGGHEPLGRSAARLRLLEALAAADRPLSVSEVAERIGVDQPRASRLVQAVVAEGFVIREADAADARRTNLVLTDAGRAVFAQARGARADAVEQALSGFSSEERAQLATLLARLADAWPR